MKAKQLPLSTKKIQHDLDQAGLKTGLACLELGKCKKIKASGQ